MPNFSDIVKNKMSSFQSPISLLRPTLPNLKPMPSYHKMCWYELVLTNFTPLSPPFWVIWILKPRVLLRKRYYEAALLFRSWKKGGLKILDSVPPCAVTAVRLIYSWFVWCPNMDRTLFYSSILMGCGYLGVLFNLGWGHSAPKTKSFLQGKFLWMFKWV